MHVRQILILVYDWHHVEKYASCRL